MKTFLVEDKNGRRIRMFALVGELSALVEELFDAEVDLFSTFFAADTSEQDNYDSARAAYCKVDHRLTRYEMLKAVARRVLTADNMKALSEDLELINQVYTRRNNVIHACMPHPYDFETSVLLPSRAKREGLTKKKPPAIVFTEDYVREAILQTEACLNFLWFWAQRALDDLAPETLLFGTDLKEWREVYRGAQDIIKAGDFSGAGENGPKTNTKQHS